MIRFPELARENVRLTLTHTHTHICTHMCVRVFTTSSPFTGFEILQYTRTLYAIFTGLPSFEAF